MVTWMASKGRPGEGLGTHFVPVRSATGGTLVPTGITDGGRTVVGFEYRDRTDAEAEKVRRGWVWAPSSEIDVLRVLRPMGDAGHVVLGVDGSATTFVGCRDVDGGGHRATLWLAGQGAVDLCEGESQESCAMAITVDGATVAGVRGGWACLWRPGQGSQALTLRDPLVLSSQARALSPRGEAIAGCSVSSLGDDRTLCEAVLWLEGEPGRMLGFLPGAHLPISVANAVASDGSVVAGWAASRFTHQFQAVVWKQGEGPYPLPSTEGVCMSAALSVSKDGRRIVGYEADKTRQHAVLWEEQGSARRIETTVRTEFGQDVAGLHLTSASSISPDGHEVAGTGVDKQGRFTAWRAYIP